MLAADGPVADHTGRVVGSEARSLRVVVFCVMCLLTDTGRYLLYPYGVTREYTDDPAAAEDGWLLDSLHRWNGQRLSPGLTFDQRSPDQWHIRVHWRLVNGRAMPVGIDVRSFHAADGEARHDNAGRRVFRTGERKGVWPDGDVPRPVTRELFKRLPVGEVIEQGREQVATVWETLLPHGRTSSPDPVRVAEALAATPERVSRSDWKHRRAAELYAEASRTRHRKPSLSTWRRLNDEGVSCTPERVRKWIQEARRKGYLPPSNRRGPNQ